MVGRSFRMPSPHENLYTMAANAVVKLIIQNDIDPREIGFLGLGTESSTDNAAGAVIVLGPRAGSGSLSLSSPFVFCGCTAKPCLGWLTWRWTDLECHACHAAWRCERDPSGFLLNTKVAVHFVLSLVIRTRCDQTDHV